MSRKHYRAVAEIIATEYARATSGPSPANTRETVENIVKGLADTYARDNSSFKRVLFYRACLGRDVI